MATPKRARRKSAGRKRKPQRLIRTSERSGFKTCRWLWDRAYNDRLKVIQESPALRFGSLIHEALELRYPPGKKRGPKPAPTFAKIFDKDLKEAEESWGMRADDEWTDARDLGIDMLENFVDVYGRDEDWEVIASEMTFKTPVYGSRDPDSGLWLPAEKGDDGAKLLFHYVGTMDGVWRNRMDGGIRIIDWKTTRNDPIREGQGKGVLDEQATAYWTWGVDYLIAKGIIKPRQVEHLDGMLYTFLRKAKRDPRPTNAQGQYLNKDGSVSKNQPPDYFHREIVYRSQADRDAARARAIQEFVNMERIKQGDDVAYKTPSTGAMGHCNWCGYRDICELHETGADWESLRDATMTEWDPYAAHEIEEEGKR